MEQIHNSWEVYAWHKAKRKGLKMVNGTEAKEIVQWPIFKFFFNTKSLLSCIYANKEFRPHLHCKWFIFPLEWSNSQNNLETSVNDSSVWITAGMLKEKGVKTTLNTQVHSSKQHLEDEFITLQGIAKTGTITLVLKALAFSFS